MATPRVITLVPIDSPAVSFEEAFGEYSEIRGREKRKQRKLERIENRRQVKKARIASRDEVKSDRQDARISRRQRRKAARQGIRSEQSEARQGRRSDRQAFRAERRGLRTEARVIRKGIKKGFRGNRDLEQGLDVERPEVTQGVGFEQEQYVQPETTQTYSDETQGVYDQSGYGDEGYTQPSSVGYNQGYDYGPEQGAPYTEEDYYQPESGGQGSYYGSEQGSEDEPIYNDQQDYYGDETGSESESGVYNEEGDYVGEGDDTLLDYDASGENFDGKAIDPEIQNVVDKLAWNAECVKRLEQKRKSNPNKAQAISKRIIDHKKRFNELKSSLDDYSNAEGCDIPTRKKMVKRAWSISQQKIKKAGRPKAQIVRPADDVVPVAADLKPTFSPNRIVVPSQVKSSVTGNTGLTGIDLQDDFDAPRVREVFIGADGSKSGLSFGSVAIGVALGVAAVWAIKKYNLLK
jgi:hypothetical protein